MVKTIGFIGRFTRKHYLCRYNNLRNVKFWRFDNLRNVKFWRYNNLRNVKIDQRTQVWKERSMTNFLHGRIPARGQVPFWLKVLAVLARAISLRNLPQIYIESNFMLMTVLFYGSASESSLSRHFDRIKPPFCKNEDVLYRT